MCVVHLALWIILSVTDPLNEIHKFPWLCVFMISVCILVSATVNIASVSHVHNVVIMA